MVPPSATAICTTWGSTAGFTTRKGTIGFGVLMVILGFLAFLTQAKAPQIERFAASDHWFRIPEGPYLVRLARTLWRPAERAVIKPNTFTVFLHGKRWGFDLEKGQDLSGLEPVKVIFGEIYPFTLYFKGPKNLMASELRQIILSTM